MGTQGGGSEPQARGLRRTSHDVRKLRRDVVLGAPVSSSTGLPREVRHHGPRSVQVSVGAVSDILLSRDGRRAHGSRATRRTEG
mgnify:CR=1 FL=1